MGALPPDAIERDGEALRADDEWLARHEQRRVERDHGAELAYLVGDAAALRVRLARIGAALGVTPAQRAELEGIQGRLLDELEQVGRQLGGLALDWLARGGEVELRGIAYATAAASSVAVDTAEAAAANDDAPAVALLPDAVTSPKEPALTTVARVVPEAPAAPATPVGAAVTPEPPVAPTGAPQVPPSAAPPAAAATVSLVPVKPVAALVLRRDLEPAWSREAPAVVPTQHEAWDREELGRLLEQLGPPRVLGATEVGAEVDRLDAAVDEAAFEAWRRFPSRVQRLLISLCTCRARQIQDRLQSGTDGLRLNTLFSMLTRFSAAEQPGYVNGLSRNHSPKGPTWLDDARLAWSARDELPEDEPEVRPNPQVALGALRTLLARSTFADDEV